MTSTSEVDAYLPYIRRAAAKLAYHQDTAHQEDLVQEGLFEAYRALHVRPVPRTRQAFVRAKLWRGMWRARKRWTADVTTRALPLLADPVLPPTIDARLDEDAYLRALERRCGQQARAIAENLISPCDPRICQRMLRDVQQKTRPRMHRHVRVSHRQIQETFGITWLQFRRTLHEIRAFTRAWLAD